MDILRQEQTVIKNAVIKSFIFDTLTFAVRDIGEEDSYSCLIFCFCFFFSQFGVLSWKLATNRTAEERRGAFVFPINTLNYSQAFIRLVCSRIFDRSTCIITRL